MSINCNRNSLSIRTISAERWKSLRSRNTLSNLKPASTRRYLSPKESSNAINLFHKESNTQALSAKILLVKGLECKYGQMDHTMLENGPTTSSMVLVFLIIKTETSMKDNGKMTKHMGMVDSSNRVTTKYTKVNGTSIIQKVTASKRSQVFQDLKVRS